MLKIDGIENNEQMEIIDIALANVMRKKEIPVTHILAWYMYYFGGKGKKITYQLIAEKYPNESIPNISGSKHLSVEEYDALVDSEMNKFFKVKELNVPDEYWNFPELFPQEYRDQVLEQDMRLQGYTEEEIQKGRRNKENEPLYMEGQSRQRVHQHVDAINKLIRNEISKIMKEYNER